MRSAKPIWPKVASPAQHRPQSRYRGRAAASAQQALCRLAHRDGHVDRPPRRVGRRHRVGKAGEATQVAEHDDDLAAMALKDAFVVLPDDQFGELWCEEAAQFAGALDLGELRRDPGIVN
jgi:hypothetical protein